MVFGSPAGSLRAVGTGTPPVGVTGTGKTLRAQRGSLRMGSPHRRVGKGGTLRPWRGTWKLEGPLARWAA